MRFNLLDLRRRLEMMKGETINWTDVARATGLHYNTVYNVAHNSTRRVDLGTLETLIAYFRAEGLDVEISDLLTVSTTVS